MAEHLILQVAAPPDTWQLLASRRQPETLHRACQDVAHGLAGQARRQPCHAKAMQSFQIEGGTMMRVVRISFSRRGKMPWRASGWQ